MHTRKRLKTETTYSRVYPLAAYGDLCIEVLTNSSVRLLRDLLSDVFGWNMLRIGSRTAMLLAKPLLAPADSAASG